MEKVIFSVKDIQEMLGIGKNAAYDLVNSGAFPVLKVGKKILISKSVFNNWLTCGLDNIN